MMISRFFTIFAGPETRGRYGKCHVGYRQWGGQSCFCSGALLTWRVGPLRRTAEQLSKAQAIAVIGAGLIGSLAYTFTDTFWFSAVEADGIMHLRRSFTAVVFWAILKWENVADEPHANRWLILIAYLIGLGIGGAFCSVC